ncbi:MAG: glycoside hydrolase [Anaerolineae bacterium]
MKITIIGAGGVRTPLVLKSILARQERLGLTELALMDVDAEHLELIRTLSIPVLEAGKAAFRTLWTTDTREAIQDADYVLTTFRVGGIASRIVDEQVPLRYGVLGQETTGPGGFAMALRTIPPILEYVEWVRELAADAWIINFTNPAGLITEAIINRAGFKRTIGLCDNPPTMHRAIASFLNAQPNEVFLEYFGLNHLGWVRAVHYRGQDMLPTLIAEVKKLGEMLDLPFDPGFIEALGMLPNEYLYFYYRNREAVAHILQAGQSRAQQIAPLHQRLFDELQRIHQAGGSVAEMEAAYREYLHGRHATYMSIETGSKVHEELAEAELGEAAEGYAGVALEVIGCLSGGETRVLVLDVPNRGAIVGMEEQDIVEVPCYLARGLVRPVAIGSIPDHALGLMKRVREYERLAVEAAVMGSYTTALKALALHPLVPSYGVARQILDDYIEQHGDLLPRLS